MTGAARAYMVVGMLLVVACSGRQGAGSEEQATPQPPGTIETLQGRILETGPEPGSVTLRMEDGNAVQLVGDLESELRNLSGVTVAVEGRRVTDHPTVGTFDVSGYEIIGIDGVKPEVGIIEARDTEWFLTIGDTRVALDNVPDDLKTRDGAKVWIVGERTGTRLRVQSYGVIRER